MNNAQRRQIQACIDRKAAPKAHKERMALARDSQWPPRAIIRLAFLDGDPSLHKQVESVARTWLKYAKLSFYFYQAVDEADIRISFSQPGSWSFIGIESRSVPADQATMNFGWLTPSSSPAEVSRVVLHEFGHALGCIHEHQNPAGGIPWDKAAVYAYYGGPPNNWSKKDVDHNIFQTYDADLTVHTQVDTASIMMYPIPPSLTLNGFTAGLNTGLSPMDQRFISKAYP